MVNVARVVERKLDAALGHRASAAELFSAFSSSEKLIVQMAAAHIQTAKIRDSLKPICRGGLWHLSYTHLVQNDRGGGFHLEFTPEAVQKLTKAHNIWFDILVHGTTGCPALVNLGEGSVIHRLLEHVSRAFQALHGG
jgi:hypothetical protein